MNENVIEHEAVITKNEDGKLFAEVVTNSSCDSCQLRTFCSVPNTDKKVEVNNKINYKVGQKVTVFLPEKNALQAVLWGYVYPLILVVVSLFILVGITSNEGLSALISLGILVPYYFVLYILRKKFKKKYLFKIKE